MYDNDIIFGTILPDSSAKLSPTVSKLKDDLIARLSQPKSEGGAGIGDLTEAHIAYSDMAFQTCSEFFAWDLDPSTITAEQFHAHTCDELWRKHFRRRPGERSPFADLSHDDTSTCFISTEYTVYHRIRSKHDRKSAKPGEAEADTSSTSTATAAAAETAPGPMVLGVAQTIEPPSTASLQSGPNVNQPAFGVAATPVPAKQLALASTTGRLSSNDALSKFAAVESPFRGGTPISTAYTALRPSMFLNPLSSAISDNRARTDEHGDTTTSEKGRISTSTSFGNEPKLSSMYGSLAATPWVGKVGPALAATVAPSAPRVKAENIAPGPAFGASAGPGPQQHSAGHNDGFGNGGNKRQQGPGDDNSADVPGGQVKRARVLE